MKNLYTSSIGEWKNKYQCFVWKIKTFDGQKFLMTENDLKSFMYHKFGEYVTIATVGDTDKFVKDKIGAIGLVKYKIEKFIS